MTHTTTQQDPFGILAKTKWVLGKAKHVSIDTGAIEQIADRIEGELAAGLKEDPETHYGLSGKRTEDIQRVFIQTCVNFCFWSERQDKRWAIRWKNESIEGGWYGVVAAFSRALEEGVPILDAQWLASELDEEKLLNVFRSENELTIPLIPERVRSLREAGRVLVDHFQGQAENILQRGEPIVEKLVPLVCSMFPSFRDFSIYQGHVIPFLKRAQILMHDWSRIPEVKIAGLEHLTTFADYKLPQILEHYGLIRYRDPLVENIDSYTLIPHDSEQEIEIRSANIWAIELIRQHIPKWSAAEIDAGLWLMTQRPDEKKKMNHPYHRSYTIFY